MKSLILPWVFALAVLAGCAQTPANPPESAPTVTSEATANMPAEEPVATNPEAEQVDGPELLHLWDELGQFRQDFWESKTHDERVYALTVLSDRGNKSADAALGRLASGRLTDSELVRIGYLVAKGGYANLSVPGAPNGKAAPFRPRRSEPRIPPEAIPAWKSRSVSTVEHAVEHGLPIMIFFPDETDSDWPIADPELAEISRDRAVFIRFNWTDDREYSPWHDETVVPKSKLLSDNPARDYDVEPTRPTFIIADSHGNEYFRMNKAPTGATLLRFIDKLGELTAKTESKLRGNLDKAEVYLAIDDRRAALKYMLKNFRDEYVGVKAQEDTIRAYRVLVDDTRVAMEQLIQAGDKEGLQDLAEDMRHTDIEDEIDAALEKLK